jgi:hypothetical protein
MKAKGGQLTCVFTQLLPKSYNRKCWCKEYVECRCQYPDNRYHVAQWIQSPKLWKDIQSIVHIVLCKPETRTKSIMPILFVASYSSSEILNYSTKWDFVRPHHLNIKLKNNKISVNRACMEFTKKSWVKMCHIQQITFSHKYVWVQASCGWKECISIEIWLTI